MNILKLEARQRRGDLIQYFKIEKGIETVEWQSEISSNNRPGRRRLSRPLLIRELVQNCKVRYKFYKN